MVEVFKTDKKETLYAVITARKPTKMQILKEIAKHKKESLTSVKQKYKKMDLGYIVRKKDVLELYYLAAGEERTRGTVCTIVRK